METMKIKYTLSKACKVIDGFSGKPLEDAVVTLESMMTCGTPQTGAGLNYRFKKKGNGFYIAIDLEDREYRGRAECHGYERQSFSFKANEEDPEILLITMIPDHADNRIDLTGIMKKSGKKAKDFSFFYSIDCDEYRRRVSSEVKAEGKKIRLHSYQEDSLEGRKFAVEAVSGIYTLGNFDYVDKEYKLCQAVRKEIEMGDFVHLLLQGRTDENGLFHIGLPRHITKSQTDIIFFSQNKNCRVTLDLKKRKKDGGTDAYGPISVSL